jgi:tRNA-dihydrouridine synthase B
MENIFYLAPLRGVTDNIYRNAFERHFGRFDFLLTPFIPTLKGFSINPSHIKDINPDYNDTARVIPQIIGNVPSDIITLANHIHSIGYKTVNLNLGCPHPQITRKKRGSGLLPYPELLFSILDETLSHIKCSLSVKLRLGLESADEFEKIIAVLNQFPLHEVIVHPRTGKQMYEGNVDLMSFEKYYAQIIPPVCYNGDIWSSDIFNQYKNRFQSIDRWMLGRGVLQNPFLLMKLKGDKSQKMDCAILKAFHDEIYSKSAEILCGPSHLLGKMKEFWGYIALCFNDSKHILKKIQKNSTIVGYEQIVNDLFCNENLIN